MKIKSNKKSFWHYECCFLCNTPLSFLDCFLLAFLSPGILRMRMVVLLFSYVAPFGNNVTRLWYGFFFLSMWNIWSFLFFFIVPNLLFPCSLSYVWIREDTSICIYIWVQRVWLNLWRYPWRSKVHLFTWFNFLISSRIVALSIPLRRRWMVNSISIPSDIALRWKYVSVTMYIINGLRKIFPLKLFT